MIRIQSQKTKIIVRTALAVFYIVLAALMFVSGRTHTVLFENKKADDGSYDAFKAIEINFNGGEAIELFKGERDKIMLRGQKQKISVKFTDGREDFYGEFRVPLFEDTVVLSIPALVNKHPKAVSPFKEDSQAVTE